jgi:hypothetical protein
MALHMDQSWGKKLLIKSLGFGAGVTLTIAAIVGGWFWYTSLPKRWNAKALTATLEKVDVEGDNHELLFVYTVQNNTDWDYKINDGNTIHVTNKLVQNDTYFPFDKYNRYSYVHVPIFIPARKRVDVPLHMRMTYPAAQDANATVEQRKAFQKAVREYLASETPNLDGFVLFDDSARFEIDFPAGWKRHKDLAKSSKDE